MWLRDTHTHSQQTPPASETCRGKHKQLVTIIAVHTWNIHQRVALILGYITSHATNSVIFELKDASLSTEA